MDERDALQAYIRAVLPEREKYLTQRAAKQFRGPEGFSPEEDPKTLQAFRNTLYHLQRADKVYQKLRQGELIQDFHREEFDLLKELILREIRDGHEVDLPFLRSVQRARVSLKAARGAVALAGRKEAARFLDGRMGDLVRDAERKTDRYLRKKNLTALVPRDRRGEKILPCLMKGPFRAGIPSEMLEAAYEPGTLYGTLKGEVYGAFPGLRHCGNICMKDGRTVEATVAEDIKGAAGEILSEIRRRFPSGRIRHLLSVNPSVREMQKQADHVLAGQRQVHSALLNAVPEHYRDLYPLARAMKRKFILHLGPTNSGKTYEATGRLRGASRGIYLGPLRLLAAEQFETMNLNDVPCTLLTGEEQIRVPGSRVQASTVEMADLKTHYDVAVIDECQMIADRDRGGAWTAAILGLCAEEIHLCASPDAQALLEEMIRDCGDEFSVVRHERKTPLTVENGGFRFPESVRPGDALIVFSKARVHAVAAELKREGYRVSLIYGALPPDVRRDQADRFLKGDNDVVVSTDAIAMGMNLPIERVVFLEPEKYDGDIVRPLTDAEIKQIAGRAGRYGQYDIGYVNAFGFRGTVARALNRPLPPLTEAMIRFPESLLGIPLPLSRIIEQWQAMKDKGFFSKASTDRMVRLTAMMENSRTDKTLLYRFVCIPFDETETDLLNRWRALYHAECAHSPVNVLEQLPGMIDPEGCTTPMLDALEADYRRCDLYYNYARLFLEDPERILEEIQRRKDLISQGIIHILSTQKLRQKTCPGCGHPLPWNWPYRQCEACHRRRAGRRGGNDAEETVLYTEE